MLYRQLNNINLDSKLSNLDFNIKNWRHEVANLYGFAFDKDRPDHYLDVR